MSARVGGFGEVSGLGPRLAYWANQLGKDRNYPWVGTGLIDDLKCAAKQLGVDFDEHFPAELPVEPCGGAPVPCSDCDCPANFPVEDEFANFVPTKPAPPPPPTPLVYDL